MSDFNEHDFDGTPFDVHGKEFTWKDVFIGLIYKLTFFAVIFIVMYIFVMLIT